MTTTKGIDWRDRNDTADFPDEGERVLVFSPDYPKGHEMQVRIMDARFFRISTEATMWAPINIPGVT